VYIRLHHISIRCRKIQFPVNFSQLKHQFIYDKLVVAAKSNGKQKSIRERQQLLTSTRW